MGIYFGFRICNIPAMKRAAWIVSLALLLQEACAVNSNQSQYTPKCSGGEVHKFSDGTTERCIAIIKPDTAKKPMPVLFWFHGSGGNAADCDQKQMARFAKSNGFALVCGEAVSGQWQIPRIITDATGTPCNNSDSDDVTYMEKAIEYLQQASGVYDASRLFTSGCSMGSAFSIYSSQCLKHRMPESISAFATHSTGLKVKGDGNRLPTNWGECTGCQYFPAKPSAFHDQLGLKGCIFDNKQDPRRSDPFFYRTSKALENEWNKLGMKTEAHYKDGGHCQQVPYEDIITCLDDGTGRLVHSRSEEVSGQNDSPELVV